jgi:hypothetical protein
MSNQPPRFVPTLTEVVQPARAPAVPPTDNTPARAVDRAELEEQLVQRVLQRVDLVLERRLREAVGQLILEHTELLVPQLREEIVSVVRQSVSHAFAQELENDKELPAA